MGMESIRIEQTSQLTSARAYCTTDPHLLLPILSIMEDCMVCSEVQCPGRGAPTLRAYHTFDLCSIIMRSVYQNTKAIPYLCDS